MKALIAQVSQETNSYNPIPTNLDDFVVYGGGDVIDRFANAGTVLGGMIDALQKTSVEIVPVLAATATSGGPVSDSAFKHFRDALVDGSRQIEPDIVFLDLHGAMMTPSFDDPEGELLSALRQSVGVDVPIVVGLDLHAHVTQRMSDAASLLVPCKHNPHTDLRETGALAVELGIKLLEQSIEPVSYYARIPMLLAGATETHEGPLLECHEKMRRWLASDPCALDASLCNCQPFLDARDMGQTVIVISDGPSSAAQALADEIARTLWRRRAEFVNEFAGIGEVLNRVRHEPERRPFAISDYGDRTNAGAPGDSTVILERLIHEYSDLRCAVPITDPALVEAAEQAGVGKRLKMEIGAKYTHGIFAPQLITGQVLDLTDIDFVMRGPIMGGQRVTAGRAAHIAVGRSIVVALSRPARTHDVMFYQSQGLSIASFDCVVVKSGNHFQPSYGAIATTVKADTPGVSKFDPGHMPVKNRLPLIADGRQAPIVRWQCR